jgi:hypothetical protein
MVLCGVGYDRQCRIREQLHSRRLSVVPTAISVGVGQHAVLAEGDQAGAALISVVSPMRRNAGLMMRRAPQQRHIRPAAEWPPGFFCVLR